MMQHLRLSNGDILSLGNKLGEGSEGAVFAVAHRDDVVAKIYYPNRITPAHFKKIHAMLDTPPEDVTRRLPLNHVSFAWPMALVFDGANEVGYLMPRLQIVNPLSHLIQPRLRQQHHGQLNHRHFYRTARNMALAMELLHNKNIIVGDVNATNILFNHEALVTFIDCETMQITMADGAVHRCNVGMPEYTPPELHDITLFSEVNRTANHDAFGLAVLIFQLLMQGYHPFQGRAKPGIPDVPMSHIHCMRHHIFPYVENPAYDRAIVAPPLSVLPPALQALFVRAFMQTDNRPTPKEWAKEIQGIEQRLVQCPHNPNHYYPSDGACVICAWEQNCRTANASVSRSPASQPQPNSPVSEPDTRETNAAVQAPDTSHIHEPAPQPDTQKTNAPESSHDESIDEGWQPQPQHIEITENQTGITYQNLFGDYLVGAYHIKVTDPYIRSPYQVRNLMEFIEAAARFGDQHSEIAIDLVTSIDPNNAQRQLELLNQIQNRASAMNIIFDWKFAPN
jgi:serine/threonine protein kinase